MVMCVPTYLAPSRIEGVGVHAVAFVPKGTVLWRYLPPLDQAWSAEAIAALPEVQRDFLTRYAYWDRQVGAHVLCGDHGRFMNHAEDPNAVPAWPDGPDAPGVDVAARDIAAGEEITCDYRAFDDDTAEKLTQLAQRRFV